MKKIFMFLLLFCMPIVSFGLDDACTKPDEFTIDKRCYVTDEQKQQKPYNAVVKLLTGCTGTLVNVGNGVPYLLTAKHCVDNGNRDNFAILQDIGIVLQDGSLLIATKVMNGNYDNINGENLSGDYAVYRVNAENRVLPMVYITDKKSFDSGEASISDYGTRLVGYNARLVGYGVLKIMSDKEISNYKAKYLRYLKDKKGIIAKGNESLYGFISNGGIYNDNQYAFNFLVYLWDNDEEYYWDVFRNEELKVSYCRYSSDGKRIGCQAWSGNSGGPIFDDKNAIMGIVTRGKPVIGGPDHAGREVRNSISTIPLFNVNDQ